MFTFLDNQWGVRETIVYTAIKTFLKWPSNFLDVSKNVWLPQKILNQIQVGNLGNKQTKINQIKKKKRRH